MNKYFILLLVVFYSCSQKEVMKEQPKFEEVINVYFNKWADTTIAYPYNKANYNINLENKLIHRIENAKSSVDLAVYEINLPRLVNAMIKKAAEGIDVRMVVDAKDYSEEESDVDDDHAERYTIMRLYLEKLRRGKDNKINTDDDVYMIADSPIFAVSDSAKRIEFGLPLSFDDLSFLEAKIGSKDKEGFLVVDAERKKSNSCVNLCYFSPGYQMHNKFAVVDGEWVFTGSWNFTITGLYGTENDMNAGRLKGNQQHVVEIRSNDLSAVYKQEFNEMYGTNELLPDPDNSRFHTRKKDDSIHTVFVNGIRVDVYFSPSDRPLPKIIDLVKTEADSSLFFTIFAFSDQKLVDEMKHKWEASYEDSVGEKTGFDIKGVFDSSFWNQWWSASIEMTGRKAKRESELNPNTRWKNKAPVYKEREARKLHAKTLVIDDDIVIIGSANWSVNGDKKNDENTLIIYGKKIANQFLQEMNARYKTAKWN